MIAMIGSPARRDAPGCSFRRLLASARSVAAAVKAVKPARPRHRGRHPVCLCVALHKEDVICVPFLWDCASQRQRTHNAIVSRNFLQVWFQFVFAEFFETFVMLRNDCLT